MAADPAAPAAVPSAWVAVGPSVTLGGQAHGRPPVSGRVASIAVSRYADVVYAATANGGLWRSDDQGVSWRALMDLADGNPSFESRADSLACGAVAIHPDRPDQVYVGTGEAAGAIDSFTGAGPLMSPDGGLTWVTETVVGTALTGVGFYALAVDAVDPERVAGATRSGIYLRVGSGAAARWVQQTLTAIPGAPDRDASSVVCVGGVFYAALRPGDVAQPSVVLRGTVDRSTGAATWAAIGTGFPAAAGRVTLAVHPDRKDLVYAITEQAELWRLLTSGTNTWTRVAWTPAAGEQPFVNGQGWYDLALAVDPSNADTVFVGGQSQLVDAAGLPKAPPAVAGDTYAAAVWRVSVEPGAAGPVAKQAFIGANVHSDVHALVFPRSMPQQLWLGCDGGVWLGTNPQTGSRPFEPRNSGLATFLVNALAQHPLQPAVLFAATQDNGGQATLGDEAWRLITGGDAGWCAVDWNDPYRLLVTYTHRKVFRATDGGHNPGTWRLADLPADATDGDDMYPPLAGTPPSATPAESQRVAMGTHRLWISDTFGAASAPGSAIGDWRSIPANTTADKLPNTITAIAFANFTTVYAGTAGGAVYRFVQGGGGNWTRTRIDLLGTPMPLSSVVTAIEPDWADAAGNRLWIALGGHGNRDHVWYFDGTNWTARSGPADDKGLLDVQANALAADPDNAGHLYVATDVGVWFSVNGGVEWRVWGDGLPEAAAVDLLIHRASRLIRVGTHGRGVFMRRLGPAGAVPPATVAPVQLLVREHALDIGVLPVVHELDDPARQGSKLAKGASPDIRCDAPTADGSYQFDADHRMSLNDFFGLASDDSTQVPTANQPLATRVQVLVHNHGPRWAHAVRVCVLLAEGRHGGLPALPAGWAARVRQGLPVEGNGWRTVGFASVSDVRPGHPQVATVTLSSALLPLPSALAGHEAHTLLVAVHHDNDPLVSDETGAETAADALRQVALRHITAVAQVPAAAAGPTRPARFVPLGPAPMLAGLAQGAPPVSGRSAGLAVSRYGNIVYAGTGNGGVWRSEDGGESWRPCMQAFDVDPPAYGADSLAIGAVAIHPDVPERVFVGTGEPQNSDGYSGVGMLVSEDSGRHWLREPTVSSFTAPAAAAPLPALVAGAYLVGSACYTVVVDPLQPQRALVATRVGAFLREPDGDGGWHWRRLWLATGAAPTQGDPVTGAACAANAGVTTFVMTLQGGRVFAMSTGAGFAEGRLVAQPLGQGTWPFATAPVWLKSQLPAPPRTPTAKASLRCTLAMKADDPSVVYLVREEGSGFRYDAGVDRWGQIASMPEDLTPGDGKRNWVDTQGDYDLALAVCPNDVDTIALGGSTVNARDDALSPEGKGGNWFSSIWIGKVSTSGTGYTLASRYIGARSHADVHRLVFTPANPAQLWTGNDGGVFRIDDWARPGSHFVHRNRGLPTLSSVQVVTHPTQEALILLPTQDNGGALGLGTPGWRMVTQGDAGAAAWNAKDIAEGKPARVLMTYTKNTILRGLGSLEAFEYVKVDAPDAEFRFYAPMATVGGAPSAGHGARVAFGGRRLWLSDDFGGPSNDGKGNWRSLPSGAVADFLDGGNSFITAIVFLTPERIVVGTTRGTVYLYEKPTGAAAWRAPQALATPVGFPSAPITGLAAPSGIAPAAAVQFHASLGRALGEDSVWHCSFAIDAAGAVSAPVWTRRGGNVAAKTSLLDTNHNCIVVDGADLYVGADIGIWRGTTDGAGVTSWQPFSDGLPDAAVVDLEITTGRILRAATHGLGVWERELAAPTVPAVRLLVRETALDRGHGAAVYGGLDHRGHATAPGHTPDIVVDAPQDDEFQTPASRGIDHVVFAGLEDRSAHVATHGAGVLNRVHVQVQNTGPEGCTGATVTLLLAEAPGGVVPPLPADHAGAVRAGLPVNGGGWRTLGVEVLGPLDAREPRIASFDLHSSLLPAPSALEGHASWVLLALVSHALDPFPATGTDAQALADAHRHAALKRITVTELDGDPPADQAPPRLLPTTLPLAVAALAMRRLGDMAQASAGRVVTGDGLQPTDHALNRQLQAALAHMGGGDKVPTTAFGAGLGRDVVAGAIGLDLPDWAEWLEPRPGWLHDALRRNGADADVSSTVAGAMSVIVKTAEYALAGAAAADVPRVRAFCAGMACAVASDWLLGPVLRGAAAARGPADTAGIDRAIAETWASRALFDRIPERDDYADWLPSDLPPTLVPALLRAVRETVDDSLRARRLGTTPAPAALPDEDVLEEGYGLARNVQAQGAWGMGIWFLVLLPVFLAPSLGVLFSRFGEHSRHLLSLKDDSLEPDDPANDVDDEKSWYQAANFLLGSGAPMPFAYGLGLWAMVPRRDADFVQFTAIGGTRIVMTAVAAATMGASAPVRWGAIFTPWVATDLYFLVRSIVHYAQGRPGSGFMHLMQTLPLMGLSLGWLFCLFIRKANLRRNQEFWPLWAVFTVLLLGGGLIMAWRLAAGGGLVSLLRERRDPPLPVDAFSGVDLRRLPPARAAVHADHQLWQQGAGVAGERFLPGMRPLLKLWHGTAGWEIRPFGDRVELRQGGGAPQTIALPKVQDAAALLAALQAAAAGLQGAVVEPGGYELPWPVRLADHGDDQPSWALHDTQAQQWRALPTTEDKAYLLRHAPRSRTGVQVGAGGGTWATTEAPLELVPGFDAAEPLGADLEGTALARAGDLAALLQVALAPALDASLRTDPAAAFAGGEALRRWNLDERREAEWRLVVGLDAAPDTAAERLLPGAAATDGKALARIGMVPAFEAWARVLKDDRIDLSKPVSSAAMPMIRPRGEAPRQALHSELRDALKALFNVA